MLFCFFVVDFKHVFTQRGVHTFIIRLIRVNRHLHTKSSHRRCSVRKGALRNFPKFTGKHLCQSLFFNKITGPRPVTLFKKRLWHRCFPMNFGKFLRTPFLQNNSGRLLLAYINFGLIYMHHVYMRYFL